MGKIGGFDEAQKEFEYSVEFFVSRINPERRAKRGVGGSQCPLIRRGVIYLF